MRFWQLTKSEKYCDKQKVLLMIFQKFCGCFVLVSWTSKKQIFKLPKTITNPIS